jgi:AcrR family transcriptional regulator
MASSTSPSTSSSTSGGGRGARDRILDAATTLFYTEGINATGVEHLAEHAHVSKRTLYQHFASKDELIVAYLRRFGEDKPLPPSVALDRTDISARDRLLEVFRPAPDTRGCPFLNTSAELAEPDHPARIVAKLSKQAFIDALARVATEAGARDPQQLGHRLAVLSDGAQAQAATLQSGEPFELARGIAEQLIDAATG